MTLMSSSIQVVILVQLCIVLSFTMAGPSMPQSMASLLNTLRDTSKQNFDADNRQLAYGTSEGGDEEINGIPGAEKNLARYTGVRFGKRGEGDRYMGARFGKRSEEDRHSGVRFGKRSERYAGVRFG